MTAPNYVSKKFITNCVRTNFQIMFCKLKNLLLNVSKMVLNSWSQPGCRVALFTKKLVCPIGTEVPPMKKLSVWIVSTKWASFWLKGAS